MCGCWQQAEVPKCADLRPVLALKPISARGPSLPSWLAGAGQQWPVFPAGAGPHSYTPGSKMPLQQMPSAEDRAHLIAFLKRITSPRN